MEESLREVLYETRYHASRAASSNNPSLQQQPNDSVKGSFLSLLATRGFGQLKQKLNEYRHSEKFRKLFSLFVSSRGEWVAVAAGNQITTLRKDDGYQEPCGIFTGRSLSTFTCGTWSETHDVLGVADDDDTLYFIKANGEEIFRTKIKHLNVPLSIKGLIMQDEYDIKKSLLCTFTVLTSDGSLHAVEISRDPSSSISSGCTCHIGSVVKKQYPQNIVCMDYQPQVPLIAIVSCSVNMAFTSNGFCRLSLWQKTQNMDLQQVSSTDFEGLFVKPKGYSGQLTSPKLQISPHGKFVATQDLKGCLVIFQMDKRGFSLSKFSCGERIDAQTITNTHTGGGDFLNDVVDFAWWSDCVLTVAKRNGGITMIDILNGDKLLENDPIYSMPILERVQQFPGNLFLLECGSSLDYASSGINLPSDLRLMDKYDELNSAVLHWRLISFSEKSIPEMYELLISSQKYQAALSFASRHGLDKNEVLKSQWTHSSQGINEITTLLSTIKDQAFVLSECVHRVGPTEDATRALLAHGLQLTDKYRFSEREDDAVSQTWDFRLIRLKLLQFRDRLETFIGINMGRFSVQEYNMFRVSPINEVAIALAESGKIGALNLIFKRHFYSLTPFILEVLTAIPETVPVQTYSQLLPGSSPPSSIPLREDDWVECAKMVTFINGLPENHESGIHIRTEPIAKQSLGYSWPSPIELSMWYKKRAIDIDTLSGQLDNCLCLVDFACCKGISELQQYRDDISHLQQIIYLDGSNDELNFTTSLTEWEQLSDYDKFKLMLKEVKEENVLHRLHDKAIPFMRSRVQAMMPASINKPMDPHSASYNTADSFLMIWLKELALENKLDLCLIVLEEGCKVSHSHEFFTNKAEVVECALQCIYLCTATDRWSTMASMLCNVRQLQDSEADSLKQRLKLAEGHIEAGRLLAYYQVPKSINFFLEAHSDGKSIKQIIRLLLSKFIRRQPGRSDNDWASMWSDLQFLQDKAFPFLDLEYMLMEFCRGLLKAGKFSLARNYLRGTSSVALATDKAENLVIQAAREYFFSASSLVCSEIWKAKECLNIFPNSRNVGAEADIIDAVTVRLPNLGVNILPVQFRQVKDPMEIIKLAITSQVGSYLNVDELIEISKLLGLRSQDDISAVQEAIAREAAVAGDLHLAFDLCLILARKGHGMIWDLCAALARGPALENMDVCSRKQLLGFALSNCDEESIGELLHAWKDLDMQEQCGTLKILTGKDASRFPVYGSSFISDPLKSAQGMADPNDFSGQIHSFSCEDQDMYFRNIKNTLSAVAKDSLAENCSDGKILSFAALQLQWLIDLSQKEESLKKFNPISVSGKQYVSVRAQTVVTILSWLARSGFAPRDDLIATLAKSMMESPVTEEEDIIGCSFLLNLLDAFHGVEIIEEKLRTRKNHNEISSIMNVGMIYGLLHNCGVECEGPAQKRELLLKIFQQKKLSPSSDEQDQINKAQSSFWREWKLKLEEQKRVADHSRVLEQIIPGVETARFLSGDISYMEDVVLSFIGSISTQKRKILKDVINLACTYDLDCNKVLLHYLKTVLVSEVWSIDDIKAEITEFKGMVLACAAEAIKTISFFVYPAIDGCDKERLAYIYDLLSDCYLKLEENNEILPEVKQNSSIDSTGFSHFYKICGQECIRVSFIKDLNFKNIACLQGLNLECFSSEVYAHTDGYSVEALVEMVETLGGLYGNQVPEGLISSQLVYKNHVLNLLTALKTRMITQNQYQNPENLHSLVSELEWTYDLCRKYISILSYPSALSLMKQFFNIVLSFNISFDSPSPDLTWHDCIILLINFWLKLTGDMQEFASLNTSEEIFCPRCLLVCLEVFLHLITRQKISPGQGWSTVVCYINCGFVGGFYVELFSFCKAMIFSRCGFEAIDAVFSEAVSQFPPTASVVDVHTSFDNINGLSNLYLKLLETILQELAGGSVEHMNLHHLLSSLSKLEGNLEDLNVVRTAIWARLAKYSDNLELPSNVRVYALELMQYIAATGRNLKGFSAELQANVVPWDGWEGFQSTGINRDRAEHYSVPDITGESSRLTNTLVALKSSQLASTISQNIEITPDDLLTVESAVSCFLRISESVSSEPQFDALLAILDKWEGLFASRSDEVNSFGIADAENSWSNDDWDEGWETFQDEGMEKGESKENTLLVHPLHACWMEIFRRLVMVHRHNDLLKLIDQSMLKATGTLLDEDGARSLSELVIQVDCFLAFKMALLLPYEAVQLLCLEAVESNLKQVGVSETIGKDHEFLLLVLSSGIISTIITRSSYGTTFSYICYMIGNFSRQCQEAQSSRSGNEENNQRGHNEKNIWLLFRRLILPCFVSELVKADQHVLAGFIVTRFMHTNRSLSLINVAEASLRMYLGRQLQVLQGDHSTSEDLDKPLVNTISSLRVRLPNVIQTALSMLPATA